MRIFFRVSITENFHLRVLINREQEICWLFYKNEIYVVGNQVWSRAIFIGAHRNLDYRSRDQFENIGRSHTSICRLELINTSISCSLLVFSISRSVLIVHY